MRIDVFGLDCGDSDFGIDYKIPIAIDNLSNSHMKSFVDILVDEASNIDIDSWGKYNIFEYNHPFIDGLKTEIKDKYEEYVSKLSVKPKEHLWINGWINMQQPGVGLNRHNHSLHENSYLTGVVVLKCDNSSTDFYMPLLEEVGDGVISVQNFEGQFLMFPQWVMHSVKEQESLRFTIGFDLNTSDAIEYQRKKSKNAVSMMHSIKLF